MHQKDLESVVLMRASKVRFAGQASFPTVAKPGGQVQSMQAQPKDFRQAPAARMKTNPTQGP